MRVLDAHSRKLKDISHEKDIFKKYAILSHRWEEEEILLKDVENNVAQQKQGYRKLDLCCNQAARDGWENVWIDTCCIDKSSSAELTEAINSMYRWYRSSSICYVYLCDVCIVPCSHLLGAYCSNRHGGPIDVKLANFRERLEESSWFKRGWTLQELIAPSEMVFYDHAWRRIGTKHELSDIISGITDIPVDCLKDSAQLKNYSIAQKLSWASRRVTTREEDLAYSLLGLCNVNMPLLYGEGRTAFIRLQEEIIRRSDDDSVFAWFSGRDASLAKTPWVVAGSGGLFAPHPSWFRNSGRVVLRRLGPLERRHPISTTNLGVSLNLQMIPVAMDTYFALLACNEARASLLSEEGWRLGMFLKFTGECDRFERTQRFGNTTMALKDVISMRSCPGLDPGPGVESGSEYVYRQVYVAPVGRIEYLPLDTKLVKLDMSAIVNDPAVRSRVFAHVGRERSTISVRVSDADGEKTDGMGTALICCTIQQEMFKRLGDGTPAYQAMKFRIGFDWEFCPCLSIQQFLTKIDPAVWPDEGSLEDLLESTWLGDFPTRSKSRRDTNGTDEHSQRLEELRSERLPGRYTLITQGQLFRGHPITGLRVNDARTNLFFDIERYFDKNDNWRWAILVERIDRRKPLVFGNAFSANLATYRP